MPDAEAVYSGTLIGESLQVGTELEGIALTVTKVSRVRVEDEPQLWTLIYFDVAAARAVGLARVLSRVLERDGGWYCDFRSRGPQARLAQIPRPAARLGTWWGASASRCAT
jgi:hypothetical protein